MGLGQRAWLQRQARLIRLEACDSCFENLALLLVRSPHGLCFFSFVVRTSTHAAAWVSGRLSGPAACGTQSLHQCTVLRVSSLQQLAACALLLVHMCMAGTKMHRRAAILVKHALHELAKFSVNCREGISHQRICKGVFAGSCTTTYFALCLVICRSVRCIG